MQSEFFLEIIGWVFGICAVAYIIYSILDRIPAWKTFNFKKQLIILIIAFEIPPALFFIVFSFSIAGFVFPYLAQVYVALLILTFIIYEKSKTQSHSLKSSGVILSIMLSFLLVGQSMDFGNAEVLKCQYSSLGTRIITIPSAILQIPHESEPSLDMSSRDYVCYSQVARKTQNSKLCEKLPENAPDAWNRGLCLSDTSNDSSVCLKSNDAAYDPQYCYMNVAERNNDPALCEKSGMWADGCITTVAANLRNPFLCDKLSHTSGDGYCGLMWRLCMSKCDKLKESERDPKLCDPYTMDRANRASFTKDFEITAAKETMQTTTFNEYCETRFVRN